MISIKIPSLLQSTIWAIALFTVYYIYQQYTPAAKNRRRMIRENGCKPAPKYPAKDPILGLDTLFEAQKQFKEHKALEHDLKGFLENGNTISLKILVAGIISTCEPENVKTILSLKFKDFNLGVVRQSSLGHFLGRGIFTNDGAAWEHSRAMLRPNFARSQVGDLATLEKHVKKVIAAISRDGETVDLQDLFFRLTIDSATEFLFGKSCESLEPDAEVGFAEAFTAALEGLIRRSQFGMFSKILPDPKYHAAVKATHDFIDKYVEDALEHQRRDPEKQDHDNNNRYIFSRELAKQTDDPIIIRSELLQILMAGRDTTASLLSNCWFVLAKRPDIWTKLRAEVDALNGEPPTYQQLKDMKYLRHTLNESLRLHPVVPGNSRTAVSDTIIPVGGGPDGKSPILVKKGQIVAYSVYAMHRRKDLYGEDADEFKPERWEKLRPGWEYLPFNGGPRICLGQNFALTEASYTTVRLMQAFKSIESRNPGPWEEQLALVCCSRNGTKVSLTPA